MNLFFLSICVKRCARYHFDKHMKMILELCQLLCTAWHMLDESEAKKHNLYRKTHYNHRCAVWVRAHINNYRYTVNLALALCDEWRFRYDHPPTKLHGSESILLFLKSNAPPSIPTFHIPKHRNNPLCFTLPMPQAMPDECKYKPDKLSATCCMIAYRRYYMSKHKEDITTWTVKNTDSLHRFSLSHLRENDEVKRVNLPPIYWWKQ
jgi:hypothetical protein